MKKILYVFFILVLLFSLSFAKKERNKKSKDSIIQLKDSYTFEDILTSAGDSVFYVCDHC